MIVIVGCVIVLSAVLIGFTWSGGHVGALIHPSEIVTIGGAAFGALLVSAPRKVLGDVFRGLVQTVKGSPYDKQAYFDLFALLYEFFRIARRDGLLAWETHLSDPKASPIFEKYPRIVGNHHVTEFLCDALSTAADGGANPEQLSSLLETEIRVKDEEHHAAVGALAKTADALPGFGIVAAVLGIVVTMQAIDGPVEEIGHKVGAALVGTFLGILLSYGFIAPLVGRMEFLGAAESSYFRTISAAVVAFLGGSSPKEVIDIARRGVALDRRPSRSELDELFNQVGNA
jgi:chemotaxis protein MotA